MKEIKITIEGDDNQIVDAIINELNNHLSAYATRITFTNAASSDDYNVPTLYDYDTSNLSVTFDKVLTK